MAASRQSLTDLPTVAYEHSDKPPDEHPDRDRSWLDGRWRSGGLGEMDDVFTTHPHHLLHQLLVFESLRLLVAQTLLLVLLVLGIGTLEEIYLGITLES